MCDPPTPAAHRSSAEALADAIDRLSALVLAPTLHLHPTPPSAQLAAVLWFGIEEDLCWPECDDLPPDVWSWASYMLLAHTNFVVFVAVHLRPHSPTIAAWRLVSPHAEVVRMLVQGQAWSVVAKHAAMHSLAGGLLWQLSRSAGASYEQLTAAPSMDADGGGDEREMEALRRRDDEMRELLSCPVCMEMCASGPPESLPRILPCGHTLCTSCVLGLQLLRPPHNQLTCPSCKRTCSGMPPVNYVLLPMADSLVPTRAAGVEVEASAGEGVCASMGPGAPAAPSLPRRGGAGGGGDGGRQGEGERGSTLSGMMATTQRGWARFLERGSDALHSTATAAKAVVARVATAGTEAAPREKASTREAKPPPLAAENEQAQRMTRWIEVRAWAAVSVLLEGADGCHARTAAQGQRTAAAGGEIVDLVDHPRDLGVTYTAVLQSLHVTTLALLQAMARAPPKKAGALDAWIRQFVSSSVRRAWCTVAFVVYGTMRWEALFLGDEGDAWQVVRAYFLSCALLGTCSASFPRRDVELRAFTKAWRRRVGPRERQWHYTLLISQLLFGVLGLAWFRFLGPRDSAHAGAPLARFLRLTLGFVIFLTIVTLEVSKRVMHVMMTRQCTVLWIRKWLMFGALAPLTNVALTAWLLKTGGISVQVCALPASARARAGVLFGEPMSVPARVC